MWDLITRGGFFIYPLLFCSVLALAIILERAYHFYRARIDVDGFMDRIRPMLLDGRVTEAMEVASALPGPVARVALLAMDRACGEDRIVAEGSREIRRLEANLRGLSIIAGVSPLLGLLGTVTGMIRAFMGIEKLGGKVDVSILAGGIWEAMLTTAVGLTIAIPAMVAYHLFEGKVDETKAMMKEVVMEIGRLLKDGRITAPHDPSMREEEDGIYGEEEGTLTP